MQLPPLAAALLLACVHLFAGRMRFLDGVPRSRWLSAAGGVSVAYVFLHLLPELSEHQAQMREHGALEILDQHVYLLGLLGLVVYYGAERAVRRREDETDEAEDEGLHEGIGLFWVHLVTFMLYNLVIGYLLPEREAATLGEMGLYTLALGFHFLVVDYSLRNDHRDAYRRTARWALAASIVGGWALGAFLTLHELVPVAATGFLAGGIVLNVLKEELPTERESRLWAFVAGTAAYSALLLAL